MGVCLLDVNIAVISMKHVANGSLVYRRIGGEKEAAVHLQEDVTRLQEWEKTWLMDVNPEKCEILKITNEVKPNNSD